ncbi:MAG: hypothetical protein K2N51_17105 [Lachnospiraceae bacterium]|nr:hypothetical protein [Lachnospiraceae bacterium]
MARTSAEVLIEFMPKQTITTKCTATNIDTSKSDINNLIIPASSIIQNDNFATLEHNICLLDGTFRIIEPNAKPWGYFGNVLSDDNCHVQGTNINLVLNGVNNARVELGGITLYFGDDKYTSSIEYSVDGATYQKKIINPTKKDYRLVFEDSKDIRTIKFYFRETKFPNMHPRLMEIMLGVSYHFTEKDITSLVLNEEISPISNVLPVNTAKLSVYSETGEFDIINNSVVPAIAKNNVTAVIKAIVDGKSTPLATFMLDSWETQDKYDMTFNFVSLTKELDDYTYNPVNGQNTDLRGHLQYLLGGKFAYNAPVTNSFPIWFKKGTLRELYQQLCFVYGVMSNDMNGNSFKITKIDQSKIKATLYPSQVSDDVKLTKVDSVNKVTLDLLDYLPTVPIGTTFKFKDLNYNAAYKGEMSTSGKVVEFQKPAHYFRYRLINKSNNTPVTGDSSIGSVFTGEFGASKNQYSDEWWYNGLNGDGYNLSFHFRPNNTSSINVNDYIFEIEVAFAIEVTSQYSVKKGTPKNENLLYIDKPSIFNTDNAPEFANNTLEYYSNIDLKVECSYVNTDLVRVGDTVYIYTNNNTMVKATVVKQSIDLMNGLLTKLTGISLSESIYSHEYMESDANAAMYMNNNTLI